MSDDEVVASDVPPRYLFSQMTLRIDTDVISATFEELNLYELELGPLGQVEAITRIRKQVRAKLRYVKKSFMVLNKTHFRH